MKRLIVAGILLTTVSAQAQSPTKFSPITLDEPTFMELMKYLGEQPNKFSGPLANYFAGLEQAAVIAAANDARAKAAAQPAGSAEPPAAGPPN